MRPRWSIATGVWGNARHIRSTSANPSGSMRQLRTERDSAALANIALYPSGSSQRAFGTLSTPGRIRKARTPFGSRSAIARSGRGALTSMTAVPTKRSGQADHVEHVAIVGAVEAHLDQVDPPDARRPAGGEQLLGGERRGLHVLDGEALGQRVVADVGRPDVRVGVDVRFRSHGESLVLGAIVPDALAVIPDPAAWVSGRPESVAARVPWRGHGRRGRMANRGNDRNPSTRSGDDEHAADRARDAHLPPRDEGCGGGGRRPRGIGPPRLGDREPDAPRDPSGLHPDGPEYGDRLRRDGGGAAGPGRGQAPLGEGGRLPVRDHRRLSARRTRDQHRPVHRPALAPRHRFGGREHPDGEDGPRDGGGLPRLLLVAGYDRSREGEGAVARTWRAWRRWWPARPGRSSRLGYLFSPDAPLLYGTRSIPMALNTAVGFVVLGIGLVAAVGPGGFPLKWLTGTETRARLLRAFLPPVTVAVVLVGWLTHRGRLPGRRDLGRARLGGDGHGRDPRPRPALRADRRPRGREPETGRGGTAQGARPAGGQGRRADGRAEPRLRRIAGGACGTPAFPP